MAPKSIHFHSEQLSFSLRAKTKIRAWIEHTIQQEKRTTGAITIVFCNDHYLHQINLDYLGHDTLTDIITFDYSSQELISGDLFISYERVKQNAVTYKQTAEKELRRVMIHGILHLCGYHDKTQDQKKAMRQKEDECLFEYTRKFA
jgi:rRNA maturation RNase YbeY